ncbi:hypothetical protein GQ44DRAFT_700479 [Phaeosphaeriaceae sp. PMI808]|nr:hypothetical protein GQ44DRAFT_700479 [Phaeosphaeriaceae sp. PMI808]
MVSFSLLAAVATFLGATSAAAVTVPSSQCLASYNVQSGDTCVKIVNQFQNFTTPDLYRWNPEIGTSCGGLIAGQPVCINLPPYAYPGPVKAGDIFTLQQDPVPRIPNIISTCNKFIYTDGNGIPSRESIVSNATLGVTLQQWKEWNNKSNWVLLWYFSCIGVQ